MLGLSIPSVAYRNPASLAARVNALFRAGEQGVWYDPSDISTLYQNAAGTTPVTAMEQPVGMILDKSKGLVLGAEEVINGDNEAALFSTATGPSGIRGTVTRSTDLGVAAAKFTANASGATYIYPYAGTMVPAGKAIRVSYRVYIPTAWTGAGIQPVDTSDGSLNVAAVATRDKWVSVSFIRPAKSSPWLLGIGDPNTVDHTGQSFYIDALSIRELPGNHAYQSTSASRPVLSARYNLLTKTEQFDDAAWVKNNFLAFGSGSVANATMAPDGATTADLLVPNTKANAEHYLDVGAPTSVISGTPYKISWCGKASGYKWLRLAFNASIAPANERAAWFDVEAGAKGTTQPNVTSTIETLPNGFYRCTITRTATATVTSGIGYAMITNADQGLGFTADGSSGMYFWGADLRVANDGVGLPAYQRVNTATDFAVDGFPAAEVFDGTDDNQITAAGGGSTTAFFWCSSIRVGKVGAVQTLFSDTGTNTGYRVRINASNQLELSAGNGSAYTTATTTGTVSAGRTYVVTCWHDGTNLNAQIDNGTVAQQAFATATAGTAAITVGKDNGAASGYFKGSIYAAIYVKDDVQTAAQISSTKKYCAKKGNLTL